MTAAIAYVWFSLAPPVQGQDQEFIGKVVMEVVPEGFTSRDPFVRYRNQLRVQETRRLTADDLSASIRILWETNLFEDVGYRLEASPLAPNTVRVTFIVRPYPFIVSVQLLGTVLFDEKDLRSEILKIRRGDVLDPYRLALDRRELERKYREAGFHFAQVELETVRRGNDVELVWRVFEGPLVQVDNIYFVGHPPDDVDITDHMATREWGIFRKSPFNEDQLNKDMERIRVGLHLDGYLDVLAAGRVFVKQLAFSEDKRWVDITVYVDPGPLYRVREIRFSGNTILSSETLIRQVDFFPGDPFSERNVFRCLYKIQEKYGESGRLHASILAPWVFVPGTHQVDVVFAIVEGNPVTFGRVTIEGNWKTREDRIRLDLRNDIVPGERVNLIRMNRAKKRLRDRGWFEFGPEGSKTEFVPTANPDVQDLRISVIEGHTARLQFAAGFSSSFGVLGLLEYSQRNFDLTDLPSGFSDLGDAFSGGGQVFQARLAPGAQRQTYSVSFSEPYFFGTDINFSLSLRAIETTRESYDESNRGGTITFEKRFENVSMGLQYRNTTIKITKLDPGAPASIVSLAGKNDIISIDPFLFVDTRDSWIVPTKGIRYEFSLSLVSEEFGADFDYYKISTEFQWHVHTYETASRKHHFLSTKVAMTWIEPFGDTTDIPAFDRLYAGGRGTIRGFDFRGIGPRENGDPVGGSVLALATVEYSIPLYQETVIGAFFVDAAMLSTDWETLRRDKVRVSAGFGFRFVVPNFGNVPIALDFGFVISSDDQDEEQVILFDLGRFF